MSKERVIDEFGNIHYLSMKIGQGGQGAVFLTDDPRLAIKCVLDINEEFVTDKSSIANYNKSFKRIRMYPIDEEISIAKPVALLKSHAGYVMTLLDTMMPLSKLFPSSKDIADVKNDELPEMEDVSESSIEIAKKFICYFNSGGVRKRLMVLAKAASILSKLHAQGLIYGDISPNNIFITKESESSEACFIDSDNIRFESASKTASSVYTPKYGAPEVVKGLDSMRTYGDCYAFAITAFYILTQMHPFEGSIFNNDTEDWADADINANGTDIELKAYSGLLPWIFDEKDDSNSLHQTSGFDKISLNDDLMWLFQKTFSDGLNGGYKRPSIFHWTNLLLKSADNTLKCEKCNGTFYINDFLNSNEKCPFCGASMPSFFRFDAELFQNQDHKWTLLRECFKRDFEIKLPYRLFSDFNNNHYDECVLRIKRDQNTFYIQNEKAEDFEIKIAFPDYDSGRFIPLTENKIEIDESFLDKEWFIYANIGEPRLIRCSYMKGVSK